MSAEPYSFPHIPKETMRSAQAVFGRSNFYIKVGKRLDAILKDIELDCISDAIKIPKEDTVILSMITFFEFVEKLTDDQSMDAMRTRVDWKYALHLPVNPLVFQPKLLCELRYQVLVDSISRSELQKLMDRLAVFNPPVNKRVQNYEILSLLAAICSVNRLHWAWEAMQQSLGALAVKQPGWLRQVALSHWYARFNNLSFGCDPAGSVRQSEISIEDLNADIHYLLYEVQRSNLPEIHEIEEIKILQRVIDQHNRTWSPALDSPGGSRIWIGCDSCINRSGKEGIL